MNRIYYPSNSREGASCPSGNIHVLFARVVSMSGRNCITAIRVIAIACLLPVMGYGAIYTVEGELEYSSTSGQHIDIPFVVSVSNCNWSISTTGVFNSPLSKQYYDGDVLTTFSQFPPRPEGVKPSTVGNDSVLGVEQTDMPNCLQLGMGPAWLAYASSCKFSTVNTGLVEIAWFSSLERRRDRFKTPASWSKAEQQPFLPTSVDFYFSVRGSQGVNIAANSYLTTLFASFKVIAVTNIGSLLLPLRFEFKGYEPAKVPNQASTLVFQYRGRLLKAYASIPDGALERGFGQKTFVQDERFKNWSNPVPIVQYTITNQNVPHITDPAMIKAYVQGALSLKASHQLSKDPGKQTGKKRFILLITLGVLLLLPFAIMLMRKRSTNRA